MKKLLLVIGVTVACALAASAASDWETNYEKAAARAKQEKKPLLLDFTGSDWCGWCIKLDKEVFSKKAFKEFAETNLVLVTVDFPQQKKLSSKTRKQNEELAKKYGIKGYPSIILLSSDGEKVLGKTGYQAGGPEAYVKHLQGIIGTPAK